MSSLLGFLTGRLTTRTEDIATETLGYLLRRDVSREALADLVAAAGAGPYPPLKFRTQASNTEGSRPDIVGEAADGVVHVVVEGKFWAALTDAQPLGYLRQIPVSGILMFVCPGRRVDSLWKEIEAACADGSQTIESVVTRGTIRSGQVDRRVLAVASWDAVINGFAASASRSGDATLASDIEQLRGLCADVDQAEFLPIESEEMSPALGLRLTSLAKLVDDVFFSLEGATYFSRQGLRKAGAVPGQYGRYIRIGGHGCFLKFCSNCWGSYGMSPLWLRVGNASFEQSDELHLKLAAAGLHPIRTEGERTQVALRLLLRAPQHAVVMAVIDQIAAIAAAIGTADGPISGPSETIRLDVDGPGFE